MKVKPIRSEGYVALKDYISYTRFHAFKGKYYRIKTMVLLLAILATCAYMAIYALATGAHKYLVIAGIMLLCTGMFFYVVNINVKNVCKKNAKTVYATQKTEFGKNGFVVDMLFKNPEENEHYEIFYDEVERVYFAPKAIYVYIEKRSAIIIPKRNLKINPYEARCFLQEYIPPQKLVVCV